MKRLLDIFSLMYLSAFLCAVYMFLGDRIVGTSPAVIIGLAAWFWVGYRMLFKEEKK